MAQKNIHVIKNNDVWQVKSEGSKRASKNFDTQKRRKVSDARQKLFYIMEHLQIMKDNKDSLYTIDKAIEDIKYAFDELEEAEKKYDYDKLPKSN